MFINQALKSFRKQVKEASGSGIKNLGITNTKMLIKLMLDAQNFHMGSDKMLETIRDITRKMKDGQQTFMGEAAWDVKLPFDLCWFDYMDSSLLETVHEKLKGTPLKVGMLVGRVNPEVPKDYPEIIQINPCFSYGPTKSWSMCGTSTYIKVGAFYTREELLEIYNLCVPESVKSPELIQAHIETGLTANILKMPTIDFWNETDEKTKVWRDLGQFISDYSAAVLNIFLMLLNAQNAIIETVYKKKKGKKKSLKKGETYKVLKFKIKKTSKRYVYNESEEVGKTTVMPLHIRKGHFKTYTKENPLFGKLVGRWWWPTQIVGDPENGILIKDYEAITE